MTELVAGNLPGMTVIEHHDLTKIEAREITQQIQNRVADVIVLVVRAFRGRADIALGYESWAAYIKAEFNDAPLYLPRDDRRAVVEVLRGHGMSTRNIAAVTGTHHSTIAEDVATVGNPTVEKVISEDGRVRPAKRKPPTSTPIPVNQRPGATQFSRAIQEISASIAEKSDELSDEQVAEALGAAQFLYELLRGETIIRESKAGAA